MTEGRALDFKIIRNSEFDKPKKIVIFLILGAILFLTFSGFGDSKKTEKVMEKNEFNFEEYKNRLCSEAEEALSKIKGVGNVKVVLNFESRGKMIVARNSQSKIQTDTGNSDSRETKENSDSVVVYGQGQSETPYVTEERLPVPSGVLVIASGAGNESVRLELYEAVKALYGISSHRIKVTDFKNENN